MANGLTKKVALPLIFAASAMTPALADTTISIQGPSDNNIAFDEIDEIAIVMNSTDNVSGVDLKVKLPKGLEIVDGFVKNVPTHSFKVEETADGFHVMLWSDVFEPINETTLGTFKVKANTKLKAGSTIDLTIVDVRDINNDKVSASATVTGNNSDPITIDKSKMLGIVELSAEDGDDTPTLVMSTLYEGNMPFSNTLFTPQTVAVTLKNTEALISDMEAILVLPEGMDLTEKGVWVNPERQVPNKLLSYAPLKDGEGNVVPHTYKIVYSGGLEAFNGKEGALFYFEVKAALNLAAEDVITINSIVLSDLYGVHALQNDININVQNMNQKAYEAILAGKKKAADDLAATELFDRVYDYKDVKAAREAAEAELDKQYKAGVLDLHQAEVEGLYDTYAQEITESKVANEDLKASYATKAEGLDTELVGKIPSGVTSFPEAGGVAPARAAKDAKAVTVYEWTQFFDADLTTKYDAALNAIQAYRDKVQELYDQKKEADAEKYDGALLADSEKAEGEVAKAYKAAQDAITTFENKLNSVNEANKLVFEDIADNALTNKLNDAKQYAADLENVDPYTKKGAYAGDETNHPEILAAINAAQEAINNLKGAEGPIQTGYDAKTLPFQEGIQPVIDAIQGEGGINDLIANIKTVADGVKAANDAAYAERWLDILDAMANIITFDAAHEDLLETDTYKAAHAAAEAAAKAYNDKLDELNEIGMVAKSAAELDVLKQAFLDSIDDQNDVVTNLTDLNDLIYAADDALNDAKNELERIKNDYEFMEEGVYTADLIDAIEAKIADLESRIDAIDDDVNNGTDDWQELLNENGEVDQWKADLQQLMDEINGTAEADGLDQDIANAEATYIKYHKLGDANMDGLVTTTDYVEIMNYVLMKTEYGEKYGTMPASDSEKFSQLNVSKEDGDSKINVTDAVALINLLSYGDIHGAAGARAIDANNDMLTMQTTMVNGVRRIALNLANSQMYAAAQFDLVLPEGMKVVGAQLATRANRHSLDSNVLADGTMRFAITSQNNRVFEGNEGAVVYIDVEGAGDVMFQNIEFATAAANTTAFQIGSEATGIASVKAAADGEQVYSIGGRLMNAVKKGINIIRRADGTTQKVIK